LSLAPVLAANPVNCQTFYNTLTGYGSTNTVIPYWTNKFIDTSTSAYYTLTNSSTLGSAVTIVTPGRYCFTYWSAGATAGSHFGISLNSNQLTSGIETITAAHRLVVSTNSATVADSVTCTLYCTVGDVIRPHHDVNLGLGTTAEQGFSVTYLG